MRSVFGSARPAVVSTKGLTGHGLSLSGVLEAALTVLSLNGGFLPGHRNLTCPDEVCEGLFLPTESADANVKLALNNSSGFGGANVCHVLAQL